MFNTNLQPSLHPKAYAQAALPSPEEQCSPPSDLGNQAPQADEMVEMHTTGSIKIKGVSEICKESQVLP